MADTTASAGGGSTPFDSQSTIADSKPSEQLDIKISGCELQYAFRGTAVASSSHSEQINSCMSQWTEPQGDSQTPRSIVDWENDVNHSDADVTTRRFQNVSLGVAILRQQSRQEQGLSPSAVDVVWRLLYQGLQDDSIGPIPWSISASSRGFLSILIFESPQDESDDERIELRVWLPGSHTDNIPCIYLDSRSTQSCVLASKGTVCQYLVEETADVSLATHTPYITSSAQSKTRTSTTSSTETMFRATARARVSYSHDTAYSMPAASYHTTIVSPEELYATICYHKSNSGSSPTSEVLVPIGTKPQPAPQIPNDITTSVLAQVVDATRMWISRMLAGKRHARQAEWEWALRDFSHALATCDRLTTFSHANVYRCRVLKELGLTNRCVGRYEQAMLVLQQGLARNGDEPTQELIILSGELGVVARHMNRLDEAQRAFQLQYDAAKKLQWEKPLCRAVGNLGMVNFQLSQQKRDRDLLNLAVDQLKERVQLARRLGEVAAEGVNASKAASRRQLAVTWESIGQSRLSLCYTEQGNTQEAVDAAHAALRLAHMLEDPTVIALSRFFYGRALLSQGNEEEATTQFNLPSACSCAIALCKEPSDEYYQYLRELVDAGADMDLVDSQGYTALDHAVFNGDAATEDLVLEGLRRQLGDHRQPEFARRQVEAKLRKGYRELFQEKLRPVLLSNEGDAAGTLQSLRHTYDQSMSTDSEKGLMFDRLKVLRYAEFLAFGRLPRSSDGLVLPLVPRLQAGAAGAAQQPDAVDFVIFFSYRWISTEKSRDSPDDTSNTQFRRMVAAVQSFLHLHPAVDPSRLGIWLDHSCVDQDDPMPGVSALPMIVAQCNAVISLVDEHYYERAWCSVEVMMVQRLRRAYGLHLWYEHVDVPEKGWALREGALDMGIVMAEKKLTFESDRPKVLFLERQSKLLG